MYTTVRNKNSVKVGPCPGALFIPIPYLGSLCSCCTLEMLTAAYCKVVWWKKKLITPPVTIQI